MAAFASLLACALIVLFVTDLQHKTLPNVLTLPGIVVGFVCSLFLPPGWRDSLIGIAVGGGLLFAIAEGITGFAATKGSAWGT